MKGWEMIAKAAITCLMLVACFDKASTNGELNRDFDKSDLAMCQSYRQWQVEFALSAKELVYDNKPSSHLSWSEFIDIKRGNKVPHLESMCQNVLPLPGSQANFPELE